MLSLLKMHTGNLDLCQINAQVGFYRGDVLLLLEDIEELQPTLFTSVPRLYNRIYDKVSIDDVMTHVPRSCATLMQSVAMLLSSKAP